MSYTFRVIFEGVCGYVPDRPFFKKYEGSSTPKGYWKKNPDSPRSLAVLLPDLRRPSTPKPEKSSLNLPRFRDPHFPLLKFHIGDLRKRTTRRVDLVARDISQQDEEGLLFLRREQIRFHMKAENDSEFTYAGWSPPPEAQPPRNPALEDPPNPEKPQDPSSAVPPGWAHVNPAYSPQPMPVMPDPRSREQLESVWWLPALDRIVPEGLSHARKVREDVLPSYRGPFPQGLIARVECNGGRLRTFDFNRDVDGNPLRWRFARPEALRQEGSWNQPLSNSLALEFFDVRGEVRIELKRLANEVIVENLFLAPAPGASRPVLEIVITNREPDLLFQEEGFSRMTLPDMDFQPIYELLSKADEKDIEHLPIPHPDRETFFGLREKPCAGGALST